MEADTYSNAAVIEFSNTTFVNVEVRTDKDGETAQKFRVDAIPATVLVSPDGDRVSSWVGYVGPEDYRKALEKAAGAHARLKAIEPRLKASPDDPALNAEAAELYEAMTDHRKAADVLRALASRTPDKKGRAELLVRMLKQLYNLEVEDKLNDEIREAAGQLDALDGDGKLGVQDDAAMARAMVTLNQEDHEEAIRQLEAIVARWPEGDKAPLALLWLGDLYHHAKKDNAKAEKTLKALIEKYPKSEYVRDAKNFLEHMKKHQDK
jgi:thioredoxin-like negative regulator of GroEL